MKKIQSKLKGISDRNHRSFNMPEGKILVGYWHNWAESEFSGSGYQQGFFTNIGLNEIPTQYNIIVVSFMKVINGSDPIPNFSPLTMSDDEFRRQVDLLHSQGRGVLISLGGADAHIVLSSGQEQALANRIIELVEKFDFDGLDIDLESSAITASDNATVIPAALKSVKEYYRNIGREFIISMAPEFPYLRIGREYMSYISSLEGYYDFIAPQFYNQAGDGVDVQGIGLITQDNETLKEDFIYYLSESIMEGTRGFIKIPHDKFVIGLPSNRDAAANGYVPNDSALTNAITRLAHKGIPAKGLMTWSINWDGGVTRDREPYEWEFINRYSHLTNEIIEPDDKPTAPTNLEAINITEETIKIIWAGSMGPIKHYNIYRDGLFVSSTENVYFTESGLQSGRTYRYQVSVTAINNAESNMSKAINVTTLDSVDDIAHWEANCWYEDNASVSFQGNHFLCVMQHESNIYWTPDIANTLWKNV
ncbi:glycosyl hydrolase family 18 protein [Aeromonas sp.]|uniref:glycosyl hydrolase family 18 protein n=1 Tax=Aeromonas sp. TaxID=647 RepID=UPI002590FC15|nr:glycosyl hydrolase family 18 protein [Aeromonas sp.]MCX7132125.1 glycosyl hydrolase family 18 protein [Aeromonas sp.]